MQVSVENLSNIEKKLNISLPAEGVDSEVAKRLHNLQSKAKIAGFRPGKVPFDLIQKRYQEAVRNEVVADKVKESYLAALDQEKLKPVGMPKIDVVSSKKAEPLAYTAIIETYPEVKLADLTQIEIEKVNAAVSEEDVNEALEKMLKHDAEWIEVMNDESRKVQKGDRILIDFTVKTYGKVLSEGEKEEPKEDHEKDVKFEVGSGEMWPEFEEQFVGKKVGEELKFTLTFPATHIDKDVAGKTADFSAKIKQLWEAKLPVLDDAFAVKCGVKEGGVEALRKKVREGMEGHLMAILQRHFHSAITDKIIAAHTFDVPKVLVEEEITRKKEQMEQELERLSGQQNKGKMRDTPRHYFADIAKKNVTMGIIFSELSNAKEIKVSPEKIREEIEKRVASFSPDRASELIDLFYQNENFLKRVEAELLEVAIFDYIKQQIKIIDKQISYKEALALR